MRIEVSHKILVFAPDLVSAEKHVLRFLDKTTLVQYDAVRPITPESCPAGDPRFWPWLAEAEAANRQTMSKLLADLRGAGTKSLEDLLVMPQGFQSKIMHTLAHLLDGFFGIDTDFYNLLEDSHWVSEPLRAEIESSPETYWLIKVVATLEALEQGSVSAIRGFEK